MNGLSTLDEIFGAFLRHIVLLALILAAGVAASLFYAVSLPREYESSAVIQIEQSQVEASTFGSASAANARTLQQLQIIEQRVMSRDNLLAIIDQENLFSEVPNMTEAQKVTALRLAARVVRVSDPALAWRPDVIPTALNITVRLGDPEVAARVANTLVSNVLDQNRSRREAQATETLAFFESEEARLGQDIAALETRIAAFKRENVDSLNAGLSSQRDQLTTLRQDRLAIEREIIDLNTGNRGTRNTLVANSLAQLREQAALLDLQIARASERIQNAPDIERELSALERELQKLTDQYQVITRNQAEAEMSLMLQASRQGESFRILEGAVPPEHPIAPNRKRIALLGSILAAMAGVVIVLFLELRNPIIRTETQLERHLGLRAVAVIPNVHVARERTWRRIFWTIGILVFAIAFFAVAAIVSIR
ncbi:GumC family protein [Cognatishimia activa]|uniref:GumC family protein n=1 Tax=Cognatishimia activa TaxID=1715691 RepID=UPI0022306511|nr:Wzz/FepE/Etk N-terminal domain-containing protein [Cognatishimia activa]UZD91698.1 Wzz/FepE/Etk N-terminal domain-containing protein [Cognatishimia activa]